MKTIIIDGIEYNLTPKERFKEGDWVIFNEHHNSVYQVEKIQGLRYYLRHYLGGTLSIRFDSELIRKWTIQDAKDGDVLVDKYNNIGIYKEIEGIYWDSYIYLGCDGTLYDFSVGGMHDQTQTHPATKGQRDNLLKAMDDAGYTFDFEKKELKKIEQNPAEEYNIAGIGSKNAQGKLGEMIKKLKPVNEVLEQKPWSEEDEMIALGIEQIVNCASLLNIAPDKLDKVRNWLNSIKDRVQPQLKLEWSEEDESVIEEVACILLNDINRADDKAEEERLTQLADKIQSIRPQSTWKPSDEQMHYLSWIANIKLGDSVVEQEVSKHLNGLLEDLKKLREE